MLKDSDVFVDYHSEAYKEFKEHYPTGYFYCVYVFMYVCMKCMYKCMYVCMYVCVLECTLLNIIVLN